MEFTDDILIQSQKDWIADKSEFKVCEKGRRTGITWVESADNVLIAITCKKDGGQNVYYIGTDKEMTEEYIDCCANWARIFNTAASEVESGIWGEGEKEDKHILTFTIRFPLSGNKIVALASRPKKIRGRQGVLVGDEAAHQDDLAELLNAAIAFLIWGGKVRLISTHFGDSNQFNQLILAIRAGKRSGSIHRVPFMKAVDEGLYKRVCLKTGKEWSETNQVKWINDIYKAYGTSAQEELDCIPSQGSNTFLSRTLIESCMQPGIPVLVWHCETNFEELPGHIREADAQDWLRENIDPVINRLDVNAPSFFGEDFGRSGDLTIIWPLQEQTDLTCITPFVVELRNVPFEQQKQILFYICDRFPNFRGGALDARGNGQYLAEVAMQRYGKTRIHQVMLTLDWYRENMPRVKAIFEEQAIIIPKNGDILDDFKSFVMNNGIAKIPDQRSKGRDGEYRHGDAGLAGSMALYAVKNINGGVIPIVESAELETEDKQYYKRHNLSGY